LSSSKKNALALFIRAEILAARAHSALSASKTWPTDTPYKLGVDKSLTEKVHERSKLLITQYRGLVELENFNENSRLAAEKHLASAAPIVERLNDYPAGGVDLTNLVTYPPKIQPVPVKPLFFDVAWNYIDYPGQVPLAATAAEAFSSNAPNQPDDKQSAKRGWFGFGRS
jgi:signal recognition particle subunit SRP68